MKSLGISKLCFVILQRLGRPFACESFKTQHPHHEFTDLKFPIAVSHLFQHAVCRGFYSGKHKMRSRDHHFTFSGLAPAIVDQRIYYAGNQTKVRMHLIEIVQHGRLECPSQRAVKVHLKTEPIFHADIFV